MSFLVELFGSIKEFSLALGLIILLPLTVSQIADIVFPTPIKKNYVTAKYSDSNYDQQFNTYQKINTSILEKQFYLYAGSGITLLLIGVALSVPSTGTAFIVGGLGCLTIGYFNSWSAITKFVRLLSLIIAIIILCVTGMRIH